MERRAFIKLIGGAAVVWPLGVAAQKLAMPVIGVLESGSVVTIFGGDLSSKRFEILRELVPTSHAQSKNLWPKFGNTLGVPVEVVSASTENDFEPAIASLAEKHVDALYVLADTLFGSKLAAVLARHSMPAIFNTRPSVIAGGLVAYGGSLADAQYQLGSYVGRILKGEKPTDLPVIQPTKFDLIINLKTAKALGIELPRALLMQATELIE